jgi:hypothetical protein
MAFQELALKDYNQNSYWQKVENLKHSDLLLSKTQSIFQTQQVRIGDFGCSEGYNSIIFFNKLLQSLHSQGLRPSVFITHCDLPENNWTSLNQLLIKSESSYLLLPNTYSSTIGRSFFSQLFPDNYLDLSYSAFSFHYLSQPGERPEGDSGIYHGGVQKQGVLDMQHLICTRLNELKPGGYFFGIVGAQGEEKPLVTEETVNEVFANMIGRGLMSPEELASIQWNTCLLERKEWEFVLDGFKDKAEVVHFEIEKSICPYYSDYLESQEIEKYVEGLSGFYFVLLQHVIRKCLKRENKDEVMNEFHVEIRNAVRNHVAETFMHVALVVLRKKGD